MIEILRHVVEKVEERTGVPITREAQMRQFEEREAFDVLDRELLETHRDDIAYHSNAEFSDFTAILGPSDVDEDPKNIVVFRSPASDSSRLL